MSSSAEEDVPPKQGQVDAASSSIPVDARSIDLQRTLHRSPQQILREELGKTHAKFDEPVKNRAARNGQQDLVSLSKFWTLP